MSVIDDYLATVEGSKAAVLEHMYVVVREAMPEATEELSYNMPTFKWRGKGVIAILSNKNFLSIYPFCNHDRLGLDLSSYETTKGSIHFTPEHPVPDDLLRAIIAARQQQISGNKATMPKHQ
ncbi:DUF1801 domain-containing protein [Candidatus Saccharibacteria bacterium]|nr:MAG: DUF1801 domain-containing protein [Candidatus Saccharibacteria bacterium]